MDKLRQASDAERALRAQVTQLLSTELAARSAAEEQREGATDIEIALCAEVARLGAEREARQEAEARLRSASE